MPNPVSPLGRDEWLNVQKKLARALKGEAVAFDTAEGQPDYRCKPCRDTGFIVEDGLYGTKRGRRCRECRPRVDAEIRANKKHRVSDPIEDDGPPVARDWKQAAGFDGEED